MTDKEQRQPVELQLQVKEYGEVKPELVDLAKKSINAVIGEMGVAPTKPLTLHITEGIFTTQHGSNLIEFYERLEDQGNMYVAYNKGFSPKYRQQLEDRYGIPSDTPAEKIFTYAVCHSTVHYVQDIKGLNILSEFTDVSKVNPDDPEYVASRLQDPLEKEAHQIGLKVSDQLTEHSHMSEKPNDKYDFNTLFPPEVSEMMAQMVEQQDKQRTLEKEQRRKRVLPEIIVPKHIQEFIETIPHPDREQAVENAVRKQDEYLQSVWQKESAKLDPNVVGDNKLGEDLEGWKNYLRLAFDRDGEFRSKHGFIDWSKKYLAQMLSILADDEYQVRLGRPEFTNLKGGSFFDYYLGGAGVDPEIWWSAPSKLGEGSVLVHSMSQEALEKAITTGVIGREGMAAVAFCQDRIVYDRGYIAVFQANELLEVGYPLLQINEDPRDSKILKEWRSAIPVDIHLARLIAPTSVVPDRYNASQAQIATSFFGEDFLRQLPRL